MQTNGAGMGKLKRERAKQNIFLATLQLLNHGKELCDRSRNILFQEKVRWDHGAQVRAKQNPPGRTAAPLAGEMGHDRRLGL